MSNLSLRIDNIEIVIICIQSMIYTTAHYDLQTLYYII